MGNWWCWFQQQIPTGKNDSHNSQSCYLPPQTPLLTWEEQEYSRNEGNEIKSSMLKIVNLLVTLPELALNFCRLNFSGNHWVHLRASSTFRDLMRSIHVWCFGLDPGVKPPRQWSIVGIWALHIPTQQVCDSICFEIWQYVIRRQQLLVGELDSVDSNTQNLVRRVTDSPLELRELVLRGVGKLCLGKDRAGVWHPSLSCQFPPLDWGLNEEKPWRLHNGPQAPFRTS